MPTPIQKPGKSKQDYGTPPEFISAVEKRFGKLGFDLAASDNNRKARFCFTAEQDSLKQDWLRQSCYGPLWLNPPFANIGDWAKKCFIESERGAGILMLTPASVGTEWFARWVYGKAHVLFLRPRLTFEGCDDPYPKDLMLSVFGNIDPLCELWKWNE